MDLLRIERMYKGFWLLPGLLLSFVSSADELHTNAFGDVFNGSSPFSVGHVDTSTEGRLWCNAFGDVYVNGSPFKIDAKDALNLKD